MNLRAIICSCHDFTLIPFIVADDDLQDEGVGLTISSEQSPENHQSSGDMEELHLVLRLRNEQRELHDIKFDFTIGKDTSESVSRELVEAGLVDGQDLIIMAANLDRVIDSKEKQRIFRLNSGVGPNEAACDRSLLGFAQLTLIE